MNTDIRILVALEQIHGARTKWIAWTAVHTVLVATILSRIAFNHFLGRNPAWPFALCADSCCSLELKSDFTDRNAVTARSGRGFDEIKEILRRIDDDRASFVTGEGYGLRLIAWVDIVAVEGNLLRSTCVRSALLFLLCRLFLGIVCHSDLLNTRCRSRKFSFSTSCKTWARKSNAKACNASHQNKT